MADEAIQLIDRAAELSGVRRDGAGNLICPAKVARTGIYDYAGFELGKPELRRVRVYRPPEEVFSAPAMRSLAGVPVTIGHPRELVDTTNWREHAKGETASDDIVRDGEAIRVPFLLRDAEAIGFVEDGQHEVSPGYTAVIDWTAGQTEQGEAYDAVARSIRYNHLAIVDRARGGSECRIGDEGPGDKTVSTKNMIVDGFQVEVTEGSEAAITKLLDERKTATDRATKAEADLADALKTKGELEGKVTTLETQLKDATNPEALSKAATDRQELLDKAKAIVPNLVTDGKTEAEIRKAVVNAKLGEAAKDFTDDQVTGAFATLASTVKVKDKLSTAIIDGSIGSGNELDELVENRRKARASMFTHLHDAHRADNQTGDKE